MSVAAGNWRVFGWIILAVTVWCLVHTIGSYRIDPRRAWVLAACAGGFLGFWALVLLVRHRGQRANVDDVCWSVPCLASFILAVSALILFAGLSLGWFGSEARRMLAVGSAAVGITLASMFAAIVGLSDLRPRRGRIFGLAIFLLLAAVVADFFVRIAMGPG